MERALRHVFRAAIAITLALACLTQPAFAQTTDQTVPVPEQPLEKAGIDVLFVHDSRFELQRYTDPTDADTPSRLQLIYRGRVLLEAVSYFQVIARAGTSVAEAVILRAHGSRILSDNSVYRWHATVAIVVRRSGDPELWMLEISPSRDDGGLDVWTASNTLIVGDRLRPNGTRNRFQWSASGGWQQIEHAIAATFVVRPMEILAQLPSDVVPVIVDFCKTPQSALSRAACADPVFRDAEMSLTRALERAVETLEPSARPRFIYEHNAWSARRDDPCDDDDRNWSWQGPHHCVLSRTIDRSSLYGLIADRSFEDEQGIVSVGTTQLRWVYFSGGSADRRMSGQGAHALLLGQSIVVSEQVTNGYAAGTTFEMEGSRLVLVSSRGSGPLDCPRTHLIEERSNKDLRVWSVSCGYGLEKDDDGLLLTRAASPSADGVVYRWTPNAGLKFDRALKYAPTPNTNLEGLLRRRQQEIHDPPGAENPLANEEFLGRLQRVVGPSYRHFAEIFEMGAVIVSEPDDRYLVFKECDYHRFCRFGEAIRAIYDRKSGQFFFAAYRPGIGACLQTWGTPGGRNPGLESAKQFAIEYHPAAETWPTEAHELCGNPFADEHKSANLDDLPSNVTSSN
jgi:hypothetical protein